MEMLPEEEGEKEEEESSLKEEECLQVLTMTPVLKMYLFLLHLFFWKRNVYPAILVGVVTSIFGLLWYYDPSVITAISLLGIILTLGERIIVYKSSWSTTVVLEDIWTIEHENTWFIFENQVSDFSCAFCNFKGMLANFKQHYRKTFCFTFMLVFLGLAWIGSSVNNFLLAYLLAVILVLLPGFLHRRILQDRISKLVLFVSTWMKDKRKKKD